MSELTRLRSASWRRQWSVVVGAALASVALASATDGGAAAASLDRAPSGVQRVVTSTAKPADPVPGLTAASYRRPPATVRPKYRFWVPVADTSDEELRREVQQMASAGAGGLELTGFQDTDPLADLSKVGFGTPAWTHKLQVVLAEAARLGLTVDQNLGPSYPPTVPTVTDINDPAAAQQLVYATAMVQPGSSYDGALPAVSTPNGARAHLVSVVAAQCAVPACIAAGGPKLLDRSTVVDLTGKVEEGRLTWTAPPGGNAWTLFNFSRTADGLSKSGFSATGTNYVVDHLSAVGARAITDFYDAHIMTPATDALVRSMPGPASFFEDSMEMGANELWTARFGSEFSLRRGYPVATALPALTDIGQQGTTEPAYDYADGSGAVIRHDYRLTWSDLYKDAYITTLENWAHTHGMLMRAQSYGEPIQTGAVARVVGIAEGESINFGSPNPLGVEQNYRVVSGGAHTSGATRVSTECCGIFFGAYRTLAGGPDHNISGEIGTNGNLDSVYRAYAGGVTQLVWHGFPYLRAALGQVLVGQGGTWPGYNPWAIAGAIDVAEMFGPRTPQWQDYSALNRTLARDQLVLRQGHPAFDLSVYYQDLGLTGQSVSPPDSPAHQLSTTGPLSRAGYGYEYHPPQAFLATSGVYARGRLFPGRGSEKALVLNHQTTLPLVVAHRFVELARSGLAVVIIGELPSRTPGFGSARARAELAKLVTQLTRQPHVRVVDSEQEAVRALRDLRLHPAVRPAHPYRDAAPLETIHRDAPVGQYYWLYNPGDATRHAVLTLDARGTPFSLDAWTGAIRPVPTYTRGRRSVRLTVDVPPHSSRTVAVSPDRTFAGQTAPPLHTVSSTGTPVYLVDGTLAVRSTRAGDITTRLSDGRTVHTRIPRVGTVSAPTTWQLTATTWTPGDNYYETVKTQQAPRSITVASDGSLPSWLTIPGLTTSSGTGIYTAHVAVPRSWTGGFGADLDLGRVVDSAAVWINGRRLSAVNPNDLVIPARYLRAGGNTISVRIATTLFNAVHSNTLLPIYLSQTPQQYGLIGPVTVMPYGQARIRRP